MHILGQVGLILAGAVGAKLLDRNKPEWTQQVGGMTVTPGAIAAAALGVGALATGGPALGMLAGGAIAAEGVSAAERDLFPKLDAYLKPGSATTAQLPGAPGPVSGVYGHFGRVHAFDLAQGLQNYGMRAA